MAFPFIAGAINDGPEHRHDGAGHAPVLEIKTTVDFGEVRG
jgi:hypothetical protein